MAGMKLYALPVGLLTALELAFPPYVARYKNGLEIHLGRDAVWSGSDEVIANADISIDWEIWAYNGSSVQPSSSPVSVFRA